MNETGLSLSWTSAAFSWKFSVINFSLRTEISRDMEQHLEVKSKVLKRHAPRGEISHCSGRRENAILSSLFVTMFVQIELWEQEGRNFHFSTRPVKNWETSTCHPIRNNGQTVWHVKSERQWCSASSNLACCSLMNNLRVRQVSDTSNSLWSFGEMSADGSNWTWIYLSAVLKRGWTFCVVWWMIDDTGVASCCQSSILVLGQINKERNSPPAVGLNL